MFDDRDPNDVRRHVRIAFTIWAVLIVMMLWGASAFVAWISGHPQQLL